MVADTTCSVPGCTDPVRSKGWCYAHYMRDYRYGSPTARPTRAADLTGQRFGRLVALEREGRYWLCRCDCGQLTRPTTHNLTSGNTTTCGAPPCRYTARPRYSAVHERLRTTLGPARQYQCVDCGRQAAQWSYDHDDPDELVAPEGEYGAGLAYSPKLEHYLPRCVPCHKRYDLDRAAGFTQPALFGAVVG